MSLKRKLEIPLLYGKPSDKSIVNPIDWIEHFGRIDRGKIPKIPKYCVLSFHYMKATEHILKNYEIETLKYLGEETLIYAFKHKGMPVCFAHMGMGAPMAGTRLEEMFALGAEWVIFFGGAGVLDPQLRRWTILVPTKAIRDEGTSYHYQKPSRYSRPSHRLLQAIQETLKEKKVKFDEGVVWTTDAPYRETAKKRRKFKEEGAICVEMEASALFSITKFRGRHAAALFYAGDYVGEDSWDSRKEENHQRKLSEVTKNLLDISLEALHKIHVKLE